MTTTSSKNGRAATKQRESLEIGMKKDAIDGVVTTLTRALSDVEILYVKTLNVHWNFVGPNFYSVHKLLDEQYNTLQGAADELAERIRSYGAPAAGSMAEFVGHSSLEEKKGDATVDTSALAMLVADHEAIVRQLRDDIDRCTEEFGDQGAADLLTAHLQQHQEMSWMLRAHLER